METFNQTNHLTDREVQSQKQKSCLLSNTNNQTNIHLLEWSGCFALENKQWLLAENIFSSLLKKRNKVLDLIGLAKSLCGQSRLDSAEKYYLLALDNITEPCFLLFTTYKSLGEIHLLKKNFHQAEEYYNKASTLNPHCQNLIFHRAMMYLKEKNYRESEKCFQLFIKSNLDSEKAWLGLALTRKALGDEELALACLNRSLDCNPKNAKTLNLKNQWQQPPFPSETLLDSLNFSA